MLDAHAKPQSQVTAKTKEVVAKAKPVTDVWDSMGLDDQLSAKAIGLRKATGQMMDDCYDKLEKHIEETSFPFWIVDKFRALKINGLGIKDFGSPALNTVESGSIIYELAKRDGSIATFFLVHNAIGMSVVDVLGDEE